MRQVFGFILGVFACMMLSRVFQSVLMAVLGIEAEAVMETMEAWWVLPLAYSAASFLAGMVAAKTTETTGTAIAVGAFFSIAMLISLFRMPFPQWMWIFIAGPYLPFAYLGAKFSLKKSSAADETAAA